MQKLVEQLRAEVDEAKATIAEKDRDIATLQDRVFQLQDRVKDLERDAASKSRTIRRMRPSYNWYTSMYPAFRRIATTLDVAEEMFGHGSSLPAVYKHFSPQPGDIGYSSWWDPGPDGVRAHEYLPFPISCFPNIVDGTSDVIYPIWFYKWLDDRPPNDGVWVKTGLLDAVHKGEYCAKYGTSKAEHLVKILGKRFDDGFALLSRFVDLRDSWVPPPRPPRTRSTSV